MKAMILAAGFGTRLKALSQVRPKPMLPLCGAPLVGWSVRWLAHHGVSDVVVNLHHLGEQIEAELGDGSALGIRVHYTHEEGMILGTGGGLRNARHLLDDGSGEPIVVVNGKIMTNFELTKLVDHHREGGYEATMVLRSDAEGVWGGSLASRDGRLINLLGVHPDGSPASERGEMFTGIHIMQPEFLDRVPAEGEQCIVRTAYRAAFAEDRIGALNTDAYWWEHSTPERYLAGIANLVRGEVDLPHAPWAVRGISKEASVHAEASVDANAYVGPGAVVEAGAKVGPLTAVEAGARVRTGVSLERCCVWPGAVADASAADHVFVGA